MEKESPLTGILVVNKPAGLTSRDVVDHVSKILHTKKIGHTGTLDPIAEGVLILTIGKCTKLSSFLTSKTKEYIATFSLGYLTDTLDDTGKVINSSDKIVTEDEIRSCMMSFIGTYRQEVPAYSAVKVDGKRLYDYARSGIEVELPSREVTISSIDIISIEEREIKMRVTVSKGTYIRSLIRDIGNRLGTYATMSGLVRSKQGDTSLDEAYTLEDIERGNYKIVSPLEILKDIKLVEMNDELIHKVSNGVRLNLPYEDEFVAFTQNRDLYALYKRENDFYCMYIKFR